MLKNTFFVLFLPEVLQKVRRFPQAPSHMQAAPSTGMKFHRSSLREKNRPHRESRRCGVKSKVRCSRLQATMKPVESKIGKEGRNEGG